MKTLIPILAVWVMVCGCDQPTGSPKGQSSTIVTLQTNGNHSPQDNQVASVQFSADGRQLVTTSGGGTVRLWDVRMGQPLTNLSVTLGTSTGRRYTPDNPDNMPIVGPDNFQVLQDQIDALERRVKELEKKLEPARK